MVRVMVVPADGFEEGEAATVIDILRRAGFKVDGVSINGGEAEKGNQRINIG